ncbi:hypothetical protein BX600DRAFT_542276 [Xylariales sp. PMI_506]|nr:hypothetical protein BX600DRAFT_542276 [Xylariales sp. PMI_506]
MYGWCVDRVRNRVTRAAKPAFQLKTILPTNETVLNPPRKLMKPKKGPNGGDNQVLESGNESSNDLPLVLAGKALTTKPVQNTSSELAEECAEDDSNPTSSDVLKMKPAFIVNDNSRIDVMISSHEFETSMAINDFSAQSTEGSVSGSYGPVSASASLGASDSSVNSSGSTSNKYHKTMIAKYLFPRADVFLHAANLEPTTELKDAIDKIRQDKNIKDLRKLHSDFGYLFCSRVTVGGRLQTMKMLNEDHSTTEQAQKQSFKTSVGLAVNTPYGGGSVNHTSESGHATSNSQTENSQQEQHVFEAVGGDTLLASNPVAWVLTVGNHTNWRVIDRDSLTQLVDAIAELEGYQDIKMYFAQAVPALSKYLEFADTTDKKIRLRLTAPNNGLCMSYLKREATNNTWEPPKYYLGHEPMTYAMPRAMAINPQDFWADPSPLGETDLLFNPKRYRTPGIYGYECNKVGDSEFGTKYNEKFANTVWSMMAPWDEALCHETRVILRAEPQEQTNGEKETINVKVPSRPVSSLVVFRNQQGVFLPGMSDNDEVHVWRVLKKGAKPGDRVNIMEGDEIRLTWRFRDQSAGYRDFTDDVFGRRRMRAPDGVDENTVLYMKLPWPRFEPLTPQPGGRGTVAPPANSMLMSPVASDSDQPAQLAPLATVYARNKLGRPEQTVALQDCTFRLDLVGGQGGRGDVDDYLLRDIDQNVGTYDFGVPELNRQEEQRREEEMKRQLQAAIDRQREMARLIRMGVAKGFRGAVSIPAADLFVFFFLMHNDKNTLLVCCCCRNILTIFLGPWPSRTQRFRSGY